MEQETNSTRPQPEATGTQPKTGGPSERLFREHRAALRKTMHRRMYPNAVDLLAVVGILLLAGVLATLIVAMLVWMTDWDQSLITLIGYVIQMGASIAFVAVQQRARQVTSSLWRSKGRRVSAPLILWGLVLIFVTGIVIEPLLDLFPDVYLDQLNQTIGTGGWAILMTVVLAPIMEETLFRGLIQGAITERDGATRGILLSALLFGVIHFIPQQVINAFLVGIILGYIYFRTRSLITVMLLHALNNGVAYLSLELLGPERASWGMRDLIVNDVWYYIVYGLCVVLMIVGAGMIVWRLSRAEEARQAIAAAVESEGVAGQTAAATDKSTEQQK